VFVYGRDDRVTGLVAINSPRGLAKRRLLVTDRTPWSDVTRLVTA
jgi:hypothetical protein